MHSYQYRIKQWLLRGIGRWIIGVVILLVVLVALHYVINYLCNCGRITLWNWLQLLIVPAVLALGGYWLNRQQNQRQLELAERTAHDEALQAYLDQMTKMLSDKERPLRTAQPGDILSTAARVRTLTLLRRLDRLGKGDVLQFLYESGLIMKDHPVISLERADLSEAALIQAHLMDANLSWSYLRGAFLVSANLSRASLRGAWLIEADLSGRSSLRGADLRVAMLIEADLNEATLVHADLRGAGLRRANLIEANLIEANLIEANLVNAILQEANLSEANLSEANLEGADLSRAEGLTQEQLENTRGDESTKLPEGLHPPVSWTEGEGGHADNKE